MNPRVHATAFALAGTFCALALGAQQLPPPEGAYTEIDCTEYANFARRIAFFRAVEAKLELVIRQVRIDAGVPYGPRAQAFVREARVVYAEGLPPAEASYLAWRRCMAVLGRFGMEV